MSFDFTTMNKGEKKFTYELPTDSPFKKLQELTPGDRYLVRGMYISHSKDDDYDDHPVYAVNGFYIDMPSYLNDDTQKLIDNPDAVAAINASKCVIEITTYVKKKGKGKGKTFNAIEFRNLDDYTEEEKVTVR